jgi:hypothetical protein
VPHGFRQRLVEVARYIRVQGDHLRNGHRLLLCSTNTPFVAMFRIALEPWRGLG